MINTIQVGGARATSSTSTSRRGSGSSYTINDTINVGGVLRGLRTIPVVLGIASDMEERLSGRVVPQLHQPDGHAGPRRAEASEVPTAGLCHWSTGPSIPSRTTSGCRRPELADRSAGVNHLAWVTRLEHRGDDLYPALHAFVDAGRVPHDDLVRADLFRRFGRYPTESSEHHAEYNPWFIPKDDLVERLHVPIGEYLDRVAHNLNEYEETKRRLDAGEPFEIERSGEYAAVIVHALVTGEPARIVGQRPERRRPPDPEPRGRRLCRGAGARRRARASTRRPSPRCRPNARRTPVRRWTPRSSRSAPRSRRTATIYHAVLYRSPGPGGLTLDQAWRMTDELIDAGGGVAAGLARWRRPGLDVLTKEEGRCAGSDAPRRRSVAGARSR